MEPTRTPSETLRRAGFTLVELMIVILLTSVGASIGVKVTAAAMDSGVVRGAHRSFGALHARARTQAVQRGVGVTFIADATVDSVWVSEGDSIVAAVGLMEDMGVDLRSNPSRIELCMNPRGLSDRMCNSFQAPVDLEFVRGEKTSRVRVRTFGHLAEL